MEHFANAGPNLSGWQVAQERRYKERKSDMFLAAFTIAHSGRTEVVGREVVAGHD